ncbi:GspH/FimT family pseudopilin [Tepidimonas taiwanensis]|jgi:prepilin-type N-terminal cleavage/methylation domain-containing protein|nr:GspH/FimT family pseudopilin [Tepidimonas taiwanensis]UBQ04623.1 GspH/FimT family pseudopilin [Tepidimonas taiwanensis]
MPQSVHHRRARSVGLTLVEVMVVVAILAIIAAIAGPNLRPLVQRWRVDATANELASGLRLARQEALRRNNGVEFCTVNNVYLVRTVNTAPPDIKQETLRNDINVQSNVPPNNGLSCITYRGDGFPRSGLAPGTRPTWTVTTGAAARSVCVTPARIEVVNGNCP